MKTPQLMRRFLILRDIPSVRRRFPAPAPLHSAAQAPAAYGHAIAQRKKGRQPAPATSAAGLPALPVSAAAAPARAAGYSLVCWQRV